MLDVALGEQIVVHAENL